MRATYRLQLNPGFRFDDLRRVVPYLSQLGISHLYLSPVFHSREGSNHGYDVIDHSRIDPDLGERAGLEAVAAACRAHGMGLVLDIVPNHMAVLGVENAWWQDVLENGAASRYAAYFDIDWTPVRQSMRNRLLVPVLGSPLGEVIDRGEIQVEFRAEAGTFAVRYFEHRFPVEPRSYPLIVRAVGQELDEAVGDEVVAQELLSLMDAFSALAPAVAAPAVVLQKRERDRQVNQRRLARLCAREPAVGAVIERALKNLNAPAPDQLARLLEAQPYRLAFWRVSGEEINYRRFFDVNELAALRMEEQDVFASSHGLLRELWETRLIDGVRVDHADGLYDPAEYFRRLRDVLTPQSDQARPWLLAEKILGAAEKLPADWCIDGTTGYEFGALVTGWLTQPAGLEELDHVWRRHARRSTAFAEIVYRGKRQVMHTSLAAEVSGLAARLDRLAQMHRNTADFTLYDLRAAIVEAIACFPVYRTYIAPGQLSTDDVSHVRRAIGAAHSRKHGSHRALDFLERVLLGELDGDPRITAAALEFAQKFQQVTSPVMAKGVEDTAFYRYARYLPFNEVGSDPDSRGVSTEALHRANDERAREWPRAMLSTATHDTKRGEDARWRLCVLSEMPEEWAACMSRWHRLKRSRHGSDAVQEYILLQSLLGIWPCVTAAAAQSELRQRLGDYAIKAAREAKESTSWLDPDEEAEGALRALVAEMLPEQGGAGFERYFRAVIDPVAYFGMLNALAAVVLKCTAPGIPDFYQGCELPALSLVDPDNRRPVDFEGNARALAELEAQIAAGSAAEVLSRLLQGWQDGRLKLLVTHRLLQLRSTHADALAGDYLPLAVQGGRAEHVAAFARLAGDAAVITIATRWPATLCGGETRPALGAIWEDTALALAARLPPGRYTDVLTGRVLVLDPGAPGASLQLSALLQDLPCCVLAASVASG